MAIYSVQLRNDMLVTSPFKTLMDGGKINIYAGATIPATAEEALPGDETLIYTIDNATANVTFEATATGGVILKTAAETWQGLALAGGDLAYFRYYLPPDDPATLDATALRVQGTVGTAFADMIVANITKVTNDPLVIDFFALALPESN